MRQMKVLNIRFTSEEQELIKGITRCDLINLNPGKIILITRLVRNITFERRCDFCEEFGDECISNCKQLSDEVSKQIGAVDQTRYFEEIKKATTITFFRFHEGIFESIKSEPDASGVVLLFTCNSSNSSNHASTILGAYQVKITPIKFSKRDRSFLIIYAINDNFIYSQRVKRNDFVEKQIR